MTDLQTLQRDFWRAVRFDPTPSDALAHFEGDERMSSAERLAVYRNMYWYRQVEALGETFPQFREALGGEPFTKLACRYLRAHPSTRPTLEHVGQFLPAYAAEHVPEHASLCRLEWARLEALVSRDPSMVAKAAGIDAATFGTSRVRFVPSLSVVEVDSTALEAYDEAPPEREIHSVVVWRRRFTVRQLVLEPEEASALALARTGEPVAMVLASFEGDEAGIRRAFQMISRWLERQWIETFEPIPSS